MREIKFRGFSSGLHTWIYGDLQTPIKNNNLPFIRQLDKDEWFSVEEASIGQYTGFKDRNGVEIYEGDIIRSDDGVDYEIIFDADNGWIAVYEEGDEKIFFNLSHIGNKCDIEVIGNDYEAHINS